MPVTIKSTGGGSVTVQAPNTASDFTVNFPATNGDMVVAVSGAVPASQGGTGQTSLTANNVILGNGTSAVQFVAPGTNGNVLTSNGTTWASTAPATTSVYNMQVFTSSGTFTVPAGITKVKVTVVGGGGGGGYFFGSGGAGGGAAIKIISGLTPGGTVSVTVGAGGAGDTGAGGGTGGTSSFGAYCSATGGGGGVNSGASGTGGIGSSGDLNIKGSGGGAPNGDNTSLAGHGGSSFLGGGGRAVAAGSSAISGQAGGAYGGGGSGGFSGGNGGAGAAGVVIVEY